MASTVNYGLKVLITECRSCSVPGCLCTSDQNLMRKRANEYLDPSHRLDQATFNAICLDLDQNPISDRTKGSSGEEKQRNDGNFDRLVEEAFKSFREQEREITLTSSKGYFIGERKLTRRDAKPGNKYWIGAAHLRNYLEFLFVLKGVKPSLLFCKYAPENDRLFSTVVIDCLVPIMDRLDLWSYGFSLTFREGSWVFYDARSPKMDLINKAFLNNRGEAGVPDRMVGEALGYPIPFDNWHRGGRFVHIRDATELKVLNSSGWPQDESCCVDGMSFACPPGDESVWMKVLEFYDQYEEAARSVGTQVNLFIGGYREMVDWLMLNPEMLDGTVEIQKYGGPTLNQVMEKVWELGLDGRDLQRLLSGLDLEKVDLDEVLEILAEGSDMEESDMEGSDMDDDMY